MQYNLLEEAWIPCEFMDGSRSSISIPELLKGAGKIKDLDEQNPLVKGSLYRLLIAIIHRAIKGPENAKAWNYLWQNDSFPPDILSLITEYLKKWYDRFYVFHEKYPFYQVSDLKEDDPKTVAILAPHLSSGNNRTLFNHSYDDQVISVPIAKAIQWVLALQNFSLGGLTSPYKSELRKETSKSAKSSPLAQAALTIVGGKTLYKSILLNLHQYNINAEVPYPFSGDDKPAWEREENTLPDERLPMGLVDWYTFQPRAIKLLLDDDTSTISHAIVMVGEKLPDTEHRRNFELMVGFKSSKGGDPYPAINFSEDRLVWRDLNSLIGIVEGIQRPKTMDWLSDLMNDGVITLDYYPLQLFGACSDQASFLHYHYEKLPFNIKCLKDDQFMNNLEEYLTYVEKVGQSLWSALRTFFINSIPDISQKLKTSKKLEKNDNNRIRTEIQQTSLVANFWSQAELVFNGFIYQNFMNSRDIDISEWNQRNKRVGSTVMKYYLDSIGLDARTLKAGTKALKKYYGRLKND